MTKLPDGTGPAYTHNVFLSNLVTKRGVAYVAEAFGMAPTYIAEIAHLPSSKKVVEFAAEFLLGQAD